ncbi:hypothetical protein HDU82_000493 [Entophlyctis luteolus]|nr:hypothetical protein HDU82_000493 [Entophlyctis luteolus]
MFRATTAAISYFTVFAGLVKASGFVTTSGTQFMLDGCPFAFVGGNSYYTIMEDLFQNNKQATDNIIGLYSSKGLKVLRLNTMYDSSTKTSSNPWFQNITDGTAAVYNDGPTGLGLLDYVIYAAGKSGIKVVISLVNNWQAGGGMDLYVATQNGTYHDEFYTSQTLQSLYKSWVHHVLTRVNSYNNLTYNADPTIMMWELANEPRCLGNTLPASPTCSVQTIATWASTMSAYVKSIAPNQLVSLGDEGFYHNKSSVSTSYPFTANEGIDFDTILSIPTIDAGSIHTYPEGWRVPTPYDAWGNLWYNTHQASCVAANKPCYVGEYGITASSGLRNEVYASWDATWESNKMANLVWTISGNLSWGPFPDSDGFALYSTDASWDLEIGNVASSMNGIINSCLGSGISTGAVKSTSASISPATSKLSIAATSAATTVAATATSTKTSGTSGIATSKTAPASTTGVTSSKKTATTTTTTATSIKSTTLQLTSTIASQVCAILYGQCGGSGWTGPTCCSASTCTYSNPYYSQCL